MSLSGIRFALTTPSDDLKCWSTRISLFSSTTILMSIPGMVEFVGSSSVLTIKTGLLPETSSRKVGFNDASTESCLPEIATGSDLSVPRPWPYTIVIEEKKIAMTSSSVSEAEYRFSTLYMWNTSHDEED